MNKEAISDTQGITLVILFIFGSTMVMGTGGNAKNDAWISILLAIVFSIPALLVYSRILSRYPGRNLYDILEEVFGKYAGKLFILIYTWFSLHLGALVLRNFGEFISTVGLPETPKIVPIIIYGLICIMGVKSGIETLAKCSSFFVIINYSALLILALFTLPIVKTENLLPILSNGLGPVVLGAFSAFSFPFGELVLFMVIFDSLKSPGSSSAIYIKAALVGGLSITFIVARNLMVLGAETMAAVYFPSYTAISRVNIGNFLQRLEISVTIVFILSGYLKISICLLSAAKGLKKLLGFDDYRLLVTPTGLLMVNLSYLLYGSIMEMFEWAQKIWPFYSFPFQVILPFIILLAVEIKARVQKKSQL